MSEAHSLRITLTGPGGHGAMPPGQATSSGPRPSWCSRLGGVAEGLPTRDRLRVQRGHACRRHAVNVVPTSARVTGTLRTFTAAQHEEALGRLQELCNEVAKTRGSRSSWNSPSTRPRW